MMYGRLFTVGVFSAVFALPAAAQDCVECHKIGLKTEDEIKRDLTDIWRMAEELRKERGKLCAFGRTMAGGMGKQQLARVPQ